MKANDFLTALNGVLTDDFFVLYPVGSNNGFHSYYNKPKDYYVTFNQIQYDEMVGEGKTVYLITNNFDYYFAHRGSYNMRFIPYFDGPLRVVGSDRINLSAETDVVTISNLDLALLYNEYACKSQIQTLYNHCESNTLTMSRPTADNGGGASFSAEYTTVFADMATSFPNGRYQTEYKLEYAPKMFHLVKGNTITPGTIFTTWTRMPFGLINYIESPELWFPDSYAASDQIAFLVSEGALSATIAEDGIAKYSLNDAVVDISVAAKLENIVYSIENIATDALAGISAVGEFNWSLLS